MKANTRLKLEYQAYIEPMGGISTWDSKGNLTIYAGIQTPTWSRNDYAVALGIPVEKIRIVQPYFGGGFGAKLSQQVHPLARCLRNTPSSRSGSS